ncbi:MAG: DUF1836 domain-containing protein [Lachnospiraceae bacterium]|nr:DUF1836 domain-containing protein [Lachnospiraceae bacterium]
MSDRNEYIESIIAKMKTINYVQPGEIPGIELYMDQVTKFMDEYLESSKRFSDDKLLTKTMINNYTKNDLLPSPEKKKYTKDHMYMLLFIYYLKNILSISDTKAILKPLREQFFNKPGDIGFEDIYRGIFALEEDQAGIITRDVIRKLEKSKVSFEDVEDPGQRELLQKFSFIAMLCFDVYMKKQMIGLLVDEHFSGSADSEAEGGTQKSKEQKS